MERAIASVAARQLGLITRQQLLALGLSSNAIHHRLASGRFRVLHRGVYAVGGSHPSWDQQLMAALLAAGEDSAISDSCAGAYWKLEGVTVSVPEILVSHSRRIFIPGVHIRRSRTTEPTDVTRRSWLVLTTPTRTLIDLAGSKSFDELQVAVDDALRRRLTTVARLMSRVERIEGRVRGIARLREILSDRASGRIPGSPIETRFGRELRKRGFGDAVPQYEVRDASGQLIARVDFAFPDARLALEVDGSHHAGRAQWKSDLGRQNRLTLLGWRYLRFTAEEVDGDPRVWASIESALGEPNSRAMGEGLPKQLRAR